MKLNYHGKEYTLQALQYNNGNLAIALANSDDNYIISVNFDFLGIQGSAYVDINNFPDIEDLLLKAGATKTPLTKQSGFVEYPLYVFDLEKLREESPQVIDTYIKDFEKNSLNALLHY